MAKETIIIDGVRYYADRPRSCRGCFFWKNRKVGLISRSRKIRARPELSAPRAAI